jgi:dipeptidyl aminopeptidase/acylaminoacyl peptidase
MKSRTLLLALIPFALGGRLYAQTDLPYQTPPPELVAVVDAPGSPSVNIDPSGSYMLVLERKDIPTIDDIAAEMLRLGGIRIDPATNNDSRPNYYVGMKFMDLKTRTNRTITGLPDPLKVTSVSWSPDGNGFAFLELKPNGIYLWYVDVPTLTARKLTDRPLNGLLGSSMEWKRDGSGLIARLIPQNRGERPRQSEVPVGPVIQETSGNEAAVRTYQDLLKNPFDVELFDYFIQSDLFSIPLDGKISQIGETRAYTGLDISPDGRYLLVTWLTKPYSYLVPYYNFPETTEIWTADGGKVRTLFEIPLMEDIPTGWDATSPAPRSLEWRADSPSTLVWVEPLDEGNGRKEVAFRDQVYKWESPFEGKARAWIKTRLRFRGITWGKEDFALISEGSSRTRQQITSIFNPSLPDPAPVLLWDRSSEDRYGDPGRFVMTENTAGLRVLMFGKKNRVLYLSGTGASPEGDVPFLDEFDLKTKKTTRLWHSEAPYYESVSRILTEKPLTVLTSRQSVTDPPNYFIREIPGKTLTQITRFPNPYPFMDGVKKEMITYTREDGVQLSATLYTPAGWKPEDGPLPTLMWAYPREYKSRDAAGQISGSPYLFTRVSASSAVPFVTRGYAVIDGAAFPIIGEGDKEPNDTFIPQLVANAKAAIDKAAAMGVTDPKRVAVGGHSYGAFMTANLLAHCDLFAAGIARSGAYNRTLTPFGFQSETRTYWEAPEIYYEMSPFSFADKVKQPLLMIHGLADNNSGTFPIQSERFYAALKGHAATARLVLLPMESHGYVARESLLHMLWEMDRWMEKYVKNKK